MTKTYTPKAALRFANSGSAALENMAQTVEKTKQYPSDHAQSPAQLGGVIRYREDPRAARVSSLSNPDILKNMGAHAGVYRILGANMESIETKPESLTQEQKALRQTVIEETMTSSLKYVDSNVINVVPPADPENSIEVKQLNAWYSGSEVVERFENIPVAWRDMYYAKQPGIDTGNPTSGRLNYKMYKHLFTMLDVLNNPPQSAPSASADAAPFIAGSTTVKAASYNAQIGTSFGVPNNSFVYVVDWQSYINDGGTGQPTTGTFLAAMSGNLIHIGTATAIVNTVRFLGPTSNIMRVEFSQVAGDMFSNVDGSPVYLHSWVPLIDEVKGVYLNRPTYSPSRISVPAAETGKIRDIRAWVEFLHDYRKPAEVSAFEDFGLQGTQISIRSPNTNFRSAHPLWNGDQNLAFPLRTNSAIVNSTGTFGTRYTGVPELLRNSYLLWEGHGANDGLLDSLSPNPAGVSAFNHEFDHDLDMRTVFWDGSSINNPRDISVLFGNATENAPGTPTHPYEWLETSSLGGYFYQSPTWGAVKPGSPLIPFVDTTDLGGTLGRRSPLVGSIIPWMLDNRVSMGSLESSRTPLELLGLPANPPKGWVTGIGGMVPWLYSARSDGLPIGYPPGIAGRIFIRQTTNVIHTFGGREAGNQHWIAPFEVNPAQATFKLSASLTTTFDNLPTVSDIVDGYRDRYSLSYYTIGSAGNERVILVGGVSGSSYTTGVFVGNWSDPTSEIITWTPAQGLPFGLAEHQSYVSGNTVFVGPGRKAGVSSFYPVGPTESFFTGVFTATIDQTTGLPGPWGEFALPSSTFVITPYVFNAGNLAITSSDGGLTFITGTTDPFAQNPTSIINAGKDVYLALASSGAATDTWYLSRDNGQTWWNGTTPTRALTPSIESYTLNGVIYNVFSAGFGSLPVGTASIIYDVASNSAATQSIISAGTSIVKYAVPNNPLSPNPPTITELANLCPSASNTSSFVYDLVAEDKEIMRSPSAGGSVPFYSSKGSMTVGMENFAYATITATLTGPVAYATMSLWYNSAGGLVKFASSTTLTTVPGGNIMSIDRAIFPTTNYINVVVEGFGNPGITVAEMLFFAPDAPMRAVAYGNATQPYYVAVGLSTASYGCVRFTDGPGTPQHGYISQPKISTFTDTLGRPNAVVICSEMQDVCFSPSANLWIAVGSSENFRAAIYSSPDGLNWTRRFESLISGDGFSNVVASDTRIIVYGRTGFFTSTDGISWSGLTGANLPKQFGGLSDIIISDSKFVIAGLSSRGYQIVDKPDPLDPETWVIQTLYAYAAATWHSLDGLTWSDPALLESEVSIPQNTLVKPGKMAAWTNISGSLLGNPGWTFFDTIADQTGTLHNYAWTSFVSGAVAPFDVSTVRYEMTGTSYITTKDGAVQELLSSPSMGYVPVVDNQHRIWSIRTNSGSYASALTWDANQKIPVMGIPKLLGPVQTLGTFGTVVNMSAASVSGVLATLNAWTGGSTGPQVAATAFVGPQKGTDEFDTKGYQLGPSTIRPVYPILDDITAVKVFDQPSWNPNAFSLAPYHTKILGTRPGLRGTELNGNWEFMFGGASTAFNTNTGYTPSSASAIWARQVRLEAIYDTTETTHEQLISKDRRFKKASLVPAREGYRRLSIQSGSAEWDIGLNYVSVFQSPDYGRSIGISDNTASLPDYAVLTFLTGNLYAELSKSDGLSAATGSSGWFLNYSDPSVSRPSGIPYIPDSSMSLGTGSAEQVDAAAAAEVYNNTIGIQTVVPNANDMGSFLNRRGYTKTTLGRWEAVVEAQASGSSSGYFPGL